MQRIALLLLTAVVAFGQATKEPPKAVTPLEKAVAEYRKANFSAALDILDKAIADDPSVTDLYLLRGDIYSIQGQSSKAIENYGAVIKGRSDYGPAYYRRAMEYFRFGKMKESIADFDKLVELHPEQRPQLWQRGICYYYAGEYENGRKQFELHQTVNKQDVENAVWHFLCVAKEQGFEKARAQLIPIAGDSRIPMSQIFSVFAGKAAEDEVFAAAKAGSPKGEELRNQLFYAHLYLGLFEEARGNAEASLEHMRKAANEYRQKHYMGDVARVHLALREKQ